MRPVIDFAHLQATSDGGLQVKDDFAAVLRAAVGVLRNGERLHVHFSDIRYANRNEDRHVPYGEGNLRADPLKEALVDVDHPVTVISESPDATSHAAIAPGARRDRLEFLLSAISAFAGISTARRNECLGFLFPHPW